MKDQRITRIRARNFRSLGDINLPLANFNVLIGPNGSGKTNVLNTLRFLATTFRFDLAEAVAEWKGFGHIQRQELRPGRVDLVVEGTVTPYSHEGALDVYELFLTRRPNGGVTRAENFTFKRTQGQGRRITVRGTTVSIDDEGRGGRKHELASSQTTGLATLPKFSDEEGGQGIRDFAALLSAIRVLEPDVVAARLPSRERNEPLLPDASNLADALRRLQRLDPDAFQALEFDLRRCLPGLQRIEIVPVGGAARASAVQLVEAGLSVPIDLADASFGTVRLLALLCALHEPSPPPFTAIEEVDHGLHPYALDILVDRLRAASERTQILAATHSPTFVNRLRPDEIIVCSRDARTGESIIPSLSPSRIEAALEASNMRAGELWFAGVLGGVPD
jgi:predicted ATPase